MDAAATHSLAGLFGEAHVNVLALNIALDELVSQTSP